MRRGITAVCLSFAAVSMTACGGGRGRALVPPSFHGASGPGGPSSSAAGNTPAAIAMTKLYPASVSPGSIKAPPMPITPPQPSSVMAKGTPQGRKPLSVATLNFSQVPGAATDVVVARDGSLYVTGVQPSSPDKYIWHYVNGTWVNLPGAATRLALAPNGTLYATNSSGGIYEYVNGTWITIGGGTAVDITAAADNSLYVITAQGSGPDRAVWHYLPQPQGSSISPWVQMPGAGVRIAGSLDDQGHNVTGVGYVQPYGYYIVNSASQFFYYSPAVGYTQFPSTVSSVAPIIGGLFAIAAPVGNGNSIYFFDLNTATWTQEPGNATLIAAGVPLVAVIGANNAIYAAPLAVTTPVAPAGQVGAESLFISGGPYARSFAEVQIISSGGTPGTSYELPYGSYGTDFRGVTYVNYGSAGELYPCIEANFVPNGSGSVPSPRVVGFGSYPAVYNVPQPFTSYNPNVLIPSPFVGIGSDGSLWSWPESSTAASFLAVQMPPDLGESLPPPATPPSSQLAYPSSANPIPMTVTDIGATFGNLVDYNHAVTLALSHYRPTLYLGGVGPDGTSLVVAMFYNGSTSVIKGLSTGLSDPAGIAEGPDGTLYVANQFSGTITAYGPGSQGNSAPTGVITGFTDFGTSFTPMAVDSYGTLYVAYGGTVYAFPHGSYGPYSQAGHAFYSYSGNVARLDVGPASQGPTFRALPSVMPMASGQRRGFSVVGTDCTEQTQASTNNAAVATVTDDAGFTGITQSRFFWITATGKGNAVISVQTSSGKTAQVSVTVQ